MTSRSNAPAARKSLFPNNKLVRYSILGLLGISVIVVPLAFLSATPSERRASELASRYETAGAIHAPFEHILNSSGTVGSLKNATLNSQLHRTTTILSLIPAGTQVVDPVRSEQDGVVSAVRQPTSDQAIVVVTNAEGKAIAHTLEGMSEFTEVVIQIGDTVRKGDILVGDVVCQLDSADLIEREMQYEIYVTDMRASYEKAVKDTEIRKALNESLLSAAHLKAELAELDLQKYLQGTHPQELEKIQGEIASVREDLSRAQKYFDYIERMARKGYRDRDDVDSARMSLLKSELKLKEKQKSLEVLEEYSHTRTLKELQQNAAHLKFREHRVKLAGEAALAQFRVTKASRQRVYEIYAARLERYRKELRQCTIVATQAGEVVYARSSSSRSADMIEVGDRVRSQQAIAHLPDLKSLKVDARIHESMISQVRTGQTAQIEVDALPGVIIPCRLGEISSVPLPGRYPNYDQKEYIAEVLVENSDLLLSALRPEMSAKVQIVVHQSQDRVTQVPMQSVVKVGPRAYTWVLNGEHIEMRTVEVGLANDAHYVVSAGIAPGEQVVLHPREHFESQIAQLSAGHQEEQSFDWDAYELALEELPIDETIKEEFALPDRPQRVASANSYSAE